MALHVPRSVPDDADFNDLPEAPRVYGGHPSPLATAANRALAKKMLEKGKSCVRIAETLGYSGVSAFSDAFLKIYGERPSEYAKHAKAPAVKKPGGKRVFGKRNAPDRSHTKPLPRYDAKPKASKKKSKKTRRKKQAA